MKVFTVVFVSLLIVGCAFKPPLPPPCVDDGRGMYPINPTRITTEQLHAGQKQNLNNKKMENF